MPRGSGGTAHSQDRAWSSTNHFCTDRTQPPSKDCAPCGETPAPQQTNGSSFRHGTGAPPFNEEVFLRGGPALPNSASGQAPALGSVLGGGPATALESRYLHT